MTTVRLTMEMEQKLTALAVQKNTSKTELIKEALDAFIYREESGKDSYELGEKTFGQYGSGDGTLSVSYKTRLKEKINAKRHSH